MLDEVRLIRRLAAQPAMRDVIEEEMLPGPKIATDAELAADIRARAGSIFHASCTCRMGPDPQRQRRRPSASCTWPRRPAGDRRVDLPECDLGQHQRADHDGGRERRCDGSGGLGNQTAPTLTFPVKDGRGADVAASPLPCSHAALRLPCRPSNTLASTSTPLRMARGSMALTPSTRPFSAIGSMQNRPIGDTTMPAASARSARRPRPCRGEAKRAGDVETGRRARSIEQPAERAVGRVVKGLVALAIDVAHAAQMRGEMALLDEGREHRLDARRHALQEGAGYPLEDRHQRFRGKIEAEPQRREHRLREGADIDHALGMVGALQRRQRPPVIAELAVIIVLDDPGVTLVGGAEQVDAAPAGSSRRR